jgi:hypothetical protein
MQMVAGPEVIHRRFETIRVLHIRLHSIGAHCKTLKGNRNIILTEDRDERILQTATESKD